MIGEKLNPAEEAAKLTLERVFKAIDAKRCFRLEAGAGAGKTYTLIEALKYLIKENENYFIRKNYKIACITYTNVAKDEINNRTDNNPIIFAETIHAFSWNLIQGLQKQMREYIPTIGSNWKERIDAVGGIKNQEVIYSLGYPSASEKEIYLHHDDVIRIMTFFLNNKKFQTKIKSAFPVIFIDEYQDTNKDLAASIIKNLIEDESGILIGFFGDHWQKIYGSNSCGLISATEGKIQEIGKNANFRSEKYIVEMLNRMRPELPQNFKDPSSKGQINIYHTDNWVGERRTENHWQGDLPADIAHDCLVKTKEILIEEGWEFEPDKTKILMLTNNVLAEEQGYRKLVSAFSNTDDYLKLNDNYINFLKEIVEKTCIYFEKKQYGEMLKVIGNRTNKIMNKEDKAKWNEDMDKLMQLRETGTIGGVIDLLKITERPRLSAKLEQSESRYSKYPSLTNQDEIQKDRGFYEKVSLIKASQFKELSALAKFLDDETPFSTDHGVKGAEFDNVLVVCGRGWNNYNWSDFLGWEHTGIPKGKDEAHERNRNLFYVTCSRPKKRLSILFTQKLSMHAHETLKCWFGEENIHSLIVESNI